MKKNQKRIGFVILTLALVIACVATLVACNDSDVQSLKKNVPISFDANDGTGVVQKVIDISADITYTPPVREGYDFVKWTHDKEGTQPLDKNKLQAGSTLYAQWKIKTYAVYFFVNDEVTPIVTRVVEYGSSALAPSEEEIKAALADGDVFVRWDKTFDNVKSELLVYAVTEKMTCTVSFKNGDDEITSVSGKYGEKITFPLDSQIPQKDGFKFEGWEDKDGNVAEDGATFNGNATFTAKWTLLAPSVPKIQGNLNIVYGQSTTLSASVEDASSNVTYTYEWYQNGLLLGSEQSITLERLAAGTYNLRCAVRANADGQTSAEANSNITVVVKKATLTATIDNINITYGDVVPTPTIHYAGFVYEENENVVDDSEAQTSSDYKQFSAAGGTYTLTVAGLKADNYEIVGTVGEGKTVSATINVAKKIVLASGLTYAQQYTGEKITHTFDSADIEVLSGHTAVLTFTTNGTDIGEYVYNDSFKTLTKTLIITDEEGADVTSNYNVEISATIEIKPAVIEEGTHYTLPSEQNRTVVYNTLKHDWSVSANGFTVEYSTSKDGTYSSDRPLFFEAGAYTVFFRISRANYVTLESSFDVTVETAKVTVEAKDQSAVYGDDFVLNSTAYTVTEGNDYGKIAYNLVCDYKVGKGAGTYNITISVDNKNFDVTTIGANLTVTKATLVVELSDASVVYGEALALDVATIAKATSGLYDGDNLADIIALYTDYSADKDHGVNGEYYIECALKGENANYELSTVKNSNVIVKQRELTVAIKDMSVVYGNDLTFDYTITEGSILDGDDEIQVIGFSNDYTNQRGNRSQVGDLLYVTAVGSDNYKVTANQATLTITMRSVTARLSTRLSLPYGVDMSAVFAQNFTISANALPEDNDTLTSKNTYNYTLVDCNNEDIKYVPGRIGKFKLCGELNETYNYLKKNYDITVTTNDTITITPKDFRLSINKKFAYNDGKPVSFNIADALQNPVDGDVIEGTISTTFGDKGTYVIDKNNFSSSLKINADFKATNEFCGDVTSYYLLSEYNDNITIIIAEISIPHDAEEVYPFDYDGEAHGAQVTGVEDGVEISYSQDNENWAEIAPSYTDYKDGGYTVYYKLVKYDESFEDGKIEYIGSFNITINKIKCYLNPLDQYTIYGEDFVLDQSENAYELVNVLDKDKQFFKAKFDVNYKKGDYVGDYTINSDIVSSSSNYNCITGSAKLHVQPKKINLTQTEEYTVTYGYEAGDFTAFNITDTDGNTLEEAKAFIKLVNKYSVGNPVGTYSVEVEVTPPQYRKYGNYEVVESDITLTVVAREITIKTKSVSLVYGQPIELQYEIVGGELYGNDVLAVNFDFSQKHVGVFKGVNPVCDETDETTKNYIITTQSGVVTITKATLTAQLSETQTITYGDEMPQFTVVGYDGFKYEDDQNVVSGTLTVLCDYLTKKAAGKFEVSAQGLAANDYDIVYTTTYLVVKQAALTLSAVEHAPITYGDDVPPFEFTANGFVNGDTKESVLTGKVRFVTNYKKGDDANQTKYEYYLTCDALDNYTVTTVDDRRTLVVNKAKHTLAQVEEAAKNIALSGTYSYNQKLSAYNSQLKDTGFAWYNEDEIVTYDQSHDKGYRATYCTDSTNFEAYGVNEEFYINIDLAKADISVTVDGEYGAKFTGSVIDFTSIMTPDSTLPAGAKNGTITINSADCPVTYAFALIGPMSEVKDGGIYNVTATLTPSNNNYKATSFNLNFYVYSASVNGSDDWVTLENALEATSGTVYLYGNAFLSKDVIVNSGVTLIIGLKTASYSKEAGAVTVADDYVTSASTDKYAWNVKEADYTLTIRDNLTLDVQGNVIVAGKLGNTVQPVEGHTSDSYSKIINNGDIVLNGGKFDIRGLVNGSGNAIFNSGSVYSPFVVRDFKGGTYSAIKCWGLLAINKVAPFSQYEMPNIQCNNIRYYSGAALVGYADLYADDKHNCVSLNMMSSSGILQISSGTSNYIEKSYDTAKGETTLTFVGTIKLGHLAMEINGVTVDMKDTFFPISWTYNIYVGDGTAKTTVSSEYDYKILPGCVVSISKNATLSVTGSLMVYSNWTDENEIRKYPVEKGTAGMLIVDGGNFSATKFGGIVYGTNNGGTAKFTKLNGLFNNKDLSCYEHYNGSSEVEITEKARVKNSDGTETTMKKGTSYTYTNGKWA